MKQVLVRVFLPENSEFYLTPENLFDYFTNKESKYIIFGDGQKYCLAGMNEEDCYDVYHFGLEFKTDVDVESIPKAIEEGNLLYMWMIDQNYEPSLIWSDEIFGIVEDCNSNNFFLGRKDYQPFEVQPEEEENIKKFLFIYFFQKYAKENPDYSFSYDIQFEQKKSDGDPITIMVSIEPHLIPKIDLSQKRTRKCHKKEK